MNKKEPPPTSRFESEMTRMMELAINKISGLETRFDGLDKNVSEIKSDLKILKGQFNDVAIRVLEDNKRIIKLESEVEDLKSNIH